MSIPVQCMSCDARFAVKDHFEGKLIRCPECKADITVERQSADHPVKKKANSEDAPPPEKPTFARRPTVNAKPPAGMSKKLKIILFSVGGFFALCVVSCGVWATWSEQSKKSAVVYNDKMTYAHRRLVKAKDSLVLHLDDCRRRGAVPADEQAELRKQHRDLQAEIDAIRIEMSAWSPPSGARDLHQGFERAVEHDQEAMPKLASILGDAGLSEGQRRDRAGRLLAEIDSSEKAQFAELRKLQEEFARHYGIFLMPGAGFRLN